MGLIKRLPINERPREKAKIYGIESLTNEELIAVLLCTGNRKDDALILAKKLILHAGSLSSLANYSLSQLQEFDGIKEVKAIRIKASLELYKRIEIEKKQSKTKIENLLDAAYFFKTMNYDFNQENIFIMMLDNGNNILNIKNIAKGTSSSVLFSVNNIIGSCVKMNASRIIIAHNHPSDNVYPSKEDLEQTEQLKMISSVLGIDLIDHLIIGVNSFFSISKHQEIEY